MNLMSVILEVMDIGQLWRRSCIELAYVYHRDHVHVQFHTSHAPRPTTFGVMTLSCCRVIVNIAVSAQLWTKRNIQIYEANSSKKKLKRNGRAQFEAKRSNILLVSRKEVKRFPFRFEAKNKKEMKMCLLFFHIFIFFMVWISKCCVLISNCLILLLEYLSYR